MNGKVKEVVALRTLLLKVQQGLLLALPLPITIKF